MIAPPQDGTQDPFMIMTVHKRQTNAGVGGLLALMSYGVYFIWGMYILYMPNDWSSMGRGNLFHAAIGLFVGSIFGTCLGYWLVRRFRKIFIYGISNIFLVLSGCLIIPTWSTLAAPTVATYLGGIGQGLAMITVLVHMPEVATKNLRGAVVAVISLMMSTSIFTAGWFFSLVVTVDSPGLMGQIIGGLVILYALMAIVFLKCFSLESPVFLIQNNQEQDAYNTLKKLRLEHYDTYEVLRDFEELKEYVNDDKTPGIARSNFSLTPRFFQILVLRALYAVSASMLIYKYQFAFSVFISVEYGFAVLSTSRFITEMLALYMVERVGRRKLLCLSCCGCSIISIVTATVLFSVTFLEENTLVWLAILAAFYQALLGIGLSPVSVVYMSELFPLRNKAASLGAVLITENIVHIIFTGLALLTEGEAIILTIIGVLQLLLGVYFYRKLPETKGLSLRECLSLQ